MSDTPNCYTPDKFRQPDLWHIWHTLEREVSALKAERDKWRKGFYDARYNSDKFLQECFALKAERDILLAEKRTFWKDDGELRAEVERLLAENERLKSEREALKRILESSRGCRHAGDVLNRIRAALEEK